MARYDAEIESVKAALIAKGCRPHYILKSECENEIRVIYSKDRQWGWDGIVEGDATYYGPSTRLFSDLRTCMTNAQEDLFACFDN
jgi:hypothetical protein